MDGWMSVACAGTQTSRTKAPPEGFDEIEDILEEYNRKMRDGESGREAWLRSTCQSADHP